MPDGADHLDERMADRHDQVGSVISHVSHILADREPFEDFGRLALVQDHRLGALLGRGWVQPFLGKVGRKHHRPAVVDVDHAAVAVGGDDHETFVLAEFVIHQRELTDAGAERGLPVSSANEVGLLSRPAFIHPFIPAINGAERPVRPGRAKERTMATTLAAVKVAGGSARAVIEKRRARATVRKRVMEEASAIERARIAGRQVGGCGDSSRPTAAGRDRQQSANSGRFRVGKINPLFCCLRFAAPVTRSPRKTRFRSVANLYRAGVIPAGFLTPFRDGLRRHSQATKLCLAHINQSPFSLCAAMASILRACKPLVQAPARPLPPTTPPRVAPKIAALKSNWCPVAAL